MLAGVDLARLDAVVDEETRLQLQRRYLVEGLRRRFLLPLGEGLHRRSFLRRRVLERPDAGLRRFLLHRGQGFRHCFFRPFGEGFCFFFPLRRFLQPLGVGFRCAPRYPDDGLRSFLRRLEPLQHLFVGGIERLVGP